jgi:DNA-directed RNA polymerase subunit K/omega
VFPNPTLGFITPPFLTRFERAQILGQRAHDIANKKGPPIQVDAYGLHDAYVIACKELKEGKLPRDVERSLPNGTTEVWPLKDLYRYEDDES